MGQVLEDYRAPGQPGGLPDNLGRAGAGHRQAGEHLVQPGRGAQFLALAVDDPRVHRLGDLDEQDLPGERDQREIVLGRGRDQRRGQPPGVPAAEFHGQAGHADCGELADVPRLQRRFVRQRDPGGQHQLAAMQQAGRVGHLDRVHPPHRPAQQARAGQHLGAAPPDGAELEDLREGGQHGRGQHLPDMGSMAVVSTSRIRAAQAGSRPAPSRSGSATALRHVIHQARCHALCCSNEGVPGVRLEPMGELHDRHRRVIPNWVGLYYDEPLEIVSGKGSRVTDSAGRSYLDFFCGILTNMLGYDLPEVREAVERQLVTGVVHTSTLYLLRHQVELAEKIAELSGVENAKVFFTHSGTEANETALLLATAARRSSQVLALRNSYHGRSFGAVAITGNRGWKSSQLTPFGVHYLHGTDRHLPAFARMSDADYVLACTEDLRHLLATATAGDVACLIAEPLQGVGGFAAPPDGLFAAYKEVLDSHGILFISDEVQTGWGRTGEHFWGISAHGFVPDMMTFAKGLGNGFAIGGVVARGELMDGLTGNGISTFGGNPIATAAAGATLDYVLSHDLQRNAATLGKLIIDGLREAAGPLDVAGDIRGKGLMFAVDLVDPVTGAPSPVLAARMLEETRARGLLIGKGGLYGHALRMAPPLTLTEAEAREGLGILVDALRAVDAGAAAGAGQAAGGGK